MKIGSPAGALFGTALLACAVTSPLSAAVIYSENFASTTLADKPNSYLGGYFGSQLGFGEWVRSGPTAAVTADKNLSVGSDSGFRSAAVLISPTLFPSAGTYILSFDILGYKGDANDTATVGVWSGSGYDLTKKSGRALILNTQTGILQAMGGASASLLSSTTYATSGTKSVEFNYDGSSTVALFFAATTGGYPFPEVRYDNISIASAVAPAAAAAAASVPETSVSAIFGVALSFGLLRRRRTARAR